jgi:hypothetical protein
MRDTWGRCNTVFPAEATAAVGGLAPTLFAGEVADLIRGNAESERATFDMVGMFLWQPGSRASTPEMSAFHAAEFQQWVAAQLGKS